MDISRAAVFEALGGIDSNYGIRLREVSWPV